MKFAGPLSPRHRAAVLLLWAVLMAFLSLLPAVGAAVASVLPASAP